MMRASVWSTFQRGRRNKVALSSSAARLVRKTWAGPFAAGQLVHPVTVGDALLKLFQLLWRIALIGFALGIALIVAILASAQMQPPPLADSITARVRMDADTCGTEMPLLVTFHNSAPVTVQDIAFDFTAREVGRSTNLVQSQYLHSDVIIPPNNTARLCWVLPSITRMKSSTSIVYGLSIHNASAEPAS